MELLYVDFGTIVVGCEQPRTATVTIKNTGNRDIDVLSIFMQQWAPYRRPHPPLIYCLYTGVKTLAFRRNL